MGLIEDYKLYRDYEKVAKEAKGMTMQNWKTTLCGLIAGVALALGNYAGPNTWHGYLAAAALAAIGVLAKDFNITLSASEVAAIKALLSKTGMILLFVGLALMLPGRMRAQADGQTSPTPTASSSLFSAFAGPVAISYGGSWSAATLSKQLFDFKDGTKVGNNYHLYLGSYQLIAPTPNVQAYFGVIGYQPDLTALFKSTNLPSGTIGVFVDAGAGVATLPAGNSTGWLAGGGFKYRISSTVQWNLLEAYYARIGNQGAPVVSTQIGAFFGGTK